MPALTATAGPEHLPMAGKEPEPTSELETALIPTTDPEPMPMPTVEPEREAQLSLRQK